MESRPADGDSLVYYELRDPADAVKRGMLEVDSFGIVNAIALSHAHSHMLANAASYPGTCGTASG